MASEDYSLNEDRSTHGRSVSQYNWQTLISSPVSEVSGALGDIGTLLPLLIALSNSNSISLSSTLVFTGLWNILSGAFFGVPIVVQPMKAIASVAIAQKFTIGQNMAAGICTAAIITVLSSLGLIARLGRYLPVPIVKGIQMGVGLSLIMSSQKLTAGLSWSLKNNAGDNWFIAIILFIFFFTTTSRRIPQAATVFLIGLLISCTHLGSSSIHFGASIPNFSVPSLEDFKVGFFEASVGQVPLTILNSIIAVVAVSEDLLPNRDAPGITHLGLSIGCMNLVGCFFGSMPVCHGSGGLLSQHRFGARSGASVIVFGLFKILIGLLFGDSLISVFEHFPSSILAVMLFTAGLSMLDLIKNVNEDTKDLKNSQVDLTAQEKSRRWQVLMITVGLIVGFHNDGVGVLGGAIVCIIHKLQDRWASSAINDDTTESSERLLPPV